MRKTAAENKGVAVPEHNYASPTEAKQGELLHEALEIGELARDTSPNQALTLRNRILGLDIEETQYIIDAILRAKRIAVAREVHAS
ncbi:hypothetical protein O3S80_21445 [Streptomyces sp. Lzd4kr]|nr:hypothetical protein [Streptomyces sp. Lzd4kr]